jgi:flagella basal body P-ring formation protein FlgA
MKMSRIDSLLTIALAAVTALSETAAAQVVPWPSDAVDDVVALVAERLDAPADQIVLEWGPYRGEPVHPEAPVELKGSGAGGYWIASSERVGGGSASVRVRAGRRFARAVAARSVARGSALTPDDITTEPRLVWGRVETDSSSAREGWVAQRPLRPGDELVTPAVRPPLAVLSGRPVEIRWYRGSVRIIVAGTASGSASVGERVTVRTASGRRLVGVVEALGIVDVSARVTALSAGGVR